MVTVINNPKSEGLESAVGMIMGIILLLVLIGLFFLYALPALRSDNIAPVPQQNGSLDVNVTLPTDYTPPASTAPTAQ
jgi:hypothetical protein